MNISHLQPQRLAQVKASYTTRHVNFDAIATLITGITPQSGDLLLARVEQIGQHKQLELATGRKASLFPGDEIVVCYGNRYAPDQFEAEIPADLSPCHLAAAGGLAAQVLSQHVKMNLPTAITPIGLLGNTKGQPFNLADWAWQPTTYIGQRPFTLAVVGACMNAGKTTTAANLIKGLVTSGLKVGAAKITGTGAGGDVWLMSDAGASPVLDFTCVGFPSTYRATPKEVQEIMATLTSHLAAESVDVIVLEIADGIYQDETSHLVSSLSFFKAIDGIIFAAGSALGAAGGVEWLRRYKLPVLAVSGTVTTSPLATREAEKATSLPVLDLEMLRHPAILAALGWETKIAVSV